MRTIYINQDYTRVGFYKSILDEAGIPNLIRNDASHGSMTELPSPVFYPDLCVVNDEDYDRAMEILGAVHYAAPSTLPDWKCPKCNADVPGNFETCWQCSYERAPAEAKSE